MSAGSTTYANERAALLDRAEPGPVQRRVLADLADSWLAELYAAAAGGQPGVALVAVGGYGRRELSPGSDLDLVLLHGSVADIDGLAARLWYPIWDAGTRLDHSVRTVAQARRVAAEDLRALLGLLDTRHLAGDEELTESLRTAVLSDWRAFAGRRLGELRRSCRERAERSGELAFLLEPDLKESYGGLRDVTVLRAVAASWVADAPHGRLEGARELLLDVRDALHAHTGRASDRLSLQEQDAVAHQLGLRDADALLRSVSEAGRVVSYASDVTWRRVGQALATRVRRRRRLGITRPVSVAERAPLADGVVEQEGEAVLARDARPDRDPLLVLRAAGAAAQAGLPLGPGALDRLAEVAPPMPVPWPLRARDAFVALLGAGPATVPVWEALDQAGLVARLLPDWERVRSRPQRNAVHRWTVDRHLVETAVQAGALTRRVSRPDLLLVGALLHDIGKGWPGDHSLAGAAVVADLAPRMGFDDADSAVLVTLARNHLLLPDTATRRDLDDPVTVATVADAVASPEVLDLLHALVEADSRATGASVWNGWRAALVGDLVARTHAALRGVTRTAEPVLSQDQQRLADRGELAVTLAEGEYALSVTVVAPDRLGLLATLAGVLSLERLEVRSAVTVTTGPTAVQVWTVQPEFGRPPEPAVLRDSVRRALDGHVDLARRLASREAAYAARPGIPVPPPRVDVLPGASAAATVLEVRAHDRPGLLYRIGSALAAHGVDVRSARVSTHGAEAVDVFYVRDAAGRPLSTEHADRIARAVRSALA